MATTACKCCTPITDDIMMFWVILVTCVFFTCLEYTCPNYMSSIYSYFDKVVTTIDCSLLDIEHFLNR